MVHDRVAQHPNLMTFDPAKAAMPLRILSPICNVSTIRVLAVRADSPIATLEQFVEEARKKPGAVNYGTPVSQRRPPRDAHGGTRGRSQAESRAVRRGSAEYDRGAGWAYSSHRGERERGCLTSRTGKLEVLAVMHDKRLATLPECHVREKK